MKKFKVLIASMIGAIAFVFAFVFSVNINAYSVSSDNKTATWEKDKARTGLLIGNSTTYSSATFSTPTTGDIAIKNKIILIPVPSDSAAGTLTLIYVSGDKDRYAQMLTNTGAMTSSTDERIKMDDDTNNSFAFTSAYVITRGDNYYIGVGATSDFKISTIQVTLTSGEYITSYVVKYYLENDDVTTATPFKTENVNSGSVANCNLKIWGKTITGYYSNSECTVMYDTSTQITSDTNIFCKTVNVVLNPNIITNSMISDINDAFNLPTSGTNTTEISSVYTIQPSVKIATRTISDVDYTVLQTDGKTDVSSGTVVKAIKVTANTSGRFYIRAEGNGSNRNASLYPVALTSDKKLDTALATSDTIAKTSITTVSLNVENAGTYYIGFQGTTNILSIEFVEDATIYWQQGTGESTDFVRVIGVVGNVEFDNEGAISNIDKITFTYTKSGTTTLITKTVANAYTQINDGNSAYEIGYISFASHDSKLYAVYQFDGYNAFHAAGKSMDISINVYYSGSDTPVTATKTIS